MLLIISVVIVASVLSFISGIYFERLSTSQQQEQTPPDISSVQILSNQTFWSMAKGGLGFENGIPVDNYDLDAYIVLTIKNPTRYSVLLKIMGEGNVSVSYQVFEGQPRSFWVFCHNTQNFTIPPYSQDIYKLYLLRTQKNCDVPESMSVTFSQVQVVELYREAIGS
jgi:hypothetical protein